MRPARSALTMLRDAAFAALVAVVTVQGLRRWLGDRYLVPTGSMEPVLHGHEQRGDVVFVAKFERAAARRRHDLVVVRHPTKPREQLVKRIAACGDDADACWIDIRQGDVWLGPSPQHVQREVKDPFAARAQRVPWAAAPGTPASRAGVDLGAAVAGSDGRGGSAAGNGSDTGPTNGAASANGAADHAGPWRLPSSAPAAESARRAFAADVRRARRSGVAPRVLPEGAIGSVRPVDAGYVDATGARGTTGADVLVTDAGTDVVLTELTGELLATIESRHEALTFHWQPASGRVGLWRDGVDVAQTTLPPLAADAAGANVRVEFGLLDDRAFFGVDGDPARLFVVPRAPEWNTPPARDRLGGVRTLVYFAMVGPAGAGATIRSVRLFHDVYAYREAVLGPRDQPASWPRYVRPGHWFLLGDSPFDSHDSRQFGDVAASAFVGVPWFVLGPWPRTRWVGS